MAITEAQFFELEKRIQSFKATLGVANLSSNLLISQEQFAKPINVYSDDIITNSDQILNSADVDDNVIKPKIIRTWVTGSEGATPEERLARGYFSSSVFDDTGANPFVEKIICPLTKVDGTNEQAYVVFGYESASSDYYTTNYLLGDVNNITSYDYGVLAQSQSFMLNNFISPFKFGLGYKATIKQSNTTIDQSDPNNSDIIISPLNYRPGNPISEEGFANDSEGFIFDYKTGILLFGADGPVKDNDGEGDGDDPILNTKNHPLWIEIYRYIGPTGFSHPDAVITASAIHVGGDVNVDGNVDANSFSIDGFNFASTSTLTSSGSSNFGSGSVPSEVSHSFTGSVFITGGLFVDGVSTAGGGGGSSGIIKSIFTTSESFTEHGNFDKTTLFPTDGNDVLEYKKDFGLKLSSSIGTSSYVVLFGSKSSADEIKTLPNRTQDIGNSTPIYKFNGIYPYNFTSVGTVSYDLFAFTSSQYTNFKDFPILSSYAPFTSSNTSFTTHSFELSSSKVIPKISIYYSRDQETLINPLETASIEAIQFSGSNDGVNFTGLYKETNLIVKESASRSNNPIEGGTFEFLSLTVGTDLEFPKTNMEGNIEEQDLTNGTTKLITKYTTNNFQTLGTNESYKYYKLHISGGYKPGVSDVAPNGLLNGDYVQYLHHIDIFEDLNITGSNRKQITVAFDTDIHPESGLTNFQFAVSSSLSEAGLVSIEPEDNIIVNGTASSDLEMGGNSINEVGFINADLTSTFNGLINTGSLIQSGGIYLGNNPPTHIPSGSIILESLNPIFFTNNTSDGGSGVDQFSGKIFGHFTDNNVSDIYIDAYRLYNISDVEQRIQTLNPTEGLIHLTSSNIHLQGEVTASNISSSGIINASGYRINGDPFTGGGGSGFPHNQNSSENPVTASITGSLKIGEDNLGNLSANPHIILNDAGTANSLLNQNTSSALYNNGGNLYWGSTLVVDATADILTSINNGTLTGASLDLNGQGISGNGNIIIDGTISSSDNISTDGMVSASGNIITNGIVSASEMSASTFYGVFDGVFSSSIQITTDGLDTLISGASQITALGFVKDDNDTQNLSLNGNILSLTNGGTVDLSSIAGSGGGGTGAGFPFIGDAVITGSLGITGDNIGPGGPLDIVDNTDITSQNSEGGYGPIDIFTSSLTPEGGGWQLWNLYDGDTTSASPSNFDIHTAHYLSPNIISAGGLSLDINFFKKFGYTPIINSVDITYFRFNSHKRPQISGSNDSVNWEGIAKKSTDFELDIAFDDEGDVIPESLLSNGQAQVDTFSFTNTTPYKWYRLFFDVDNLHQNTNPNLDPNDIAIYELNYTSTIDVLNTGSLTVGGIYGDLYGTASYAPDNLWYEGSGYISSSDNTNVLISGNLEIQGNKIITLDDSNTFQNDNGILNIGNTNNQYDQISFKTNTNTPLVLKGNNLGIGNDNPESPLTVQGTISASGPLKILDVTLDEDNGYAPVVWNSSTGQFYITSSNSLGGVEGDDNIINNYITNVENTLWSTSSVDESITSSLDTNVRISGSLFVKDNLEIFTTPQGKNHLSVGTTDTSKTLNVSGSILVANVKDSNNPNSEGTLIESYGSDNATINNIFLKQTSDGKYGTQLFHNGSNVFDNNNQTMPGAFGIINHNNNIFGSNIITILQNNKLGLQKIKPDYDVHVGKFTFFDKNVAIASPNSMSVGAGIKPPTALTVEGDISASGNFYLNGAANIQGFAFESTTALVTSASTIFGDTQTDTHQFTGSVFLNNDLTVNGKLYATSSWATNALTASHIVGGSTVDDDWYIDDIKNHLTSSRHIWVKDNITASGHISASEGLHAGLPLKSFPNIVYYKSESGKLTYGQIAEFNISSETSLFVSPIDEIYIPTTNMVSVQRDTGTTSTTNPGSSTNDDVTSNSGSLVDQLFNGINYFSINPFSINTSQKAANVIFTFPEPVIVSQFRHNFHNEDPNSFYLPQSIEIYGHSASFESGNEGTLLATGSSPNNILVQSNPPNIIGGDLSLTPSFLDQNLHRTTSIAETSLSSSFQFYRIRYSGSLEKGNSINITEITPVTRSFTVGTSITFNEGTVNGANIITSNLEGTASHAIYSDYSGLADNGFPFVGDAFISGSLSVSGCIYSECLEMSGNINMNGFSINNISSFDALNGSIGDLTSNIINTNILNTSILNITGALNTMGSIGITTVIPSNITESYDGLNAIEVQKRGPEVISATVNPDTVNLSLNNYAFTSSSINDLIDNDLTSSIYVKQNTFGFTTITNPYGSYPTYEVDGPFTGIQYLEQTSSFYIKLKFPEPVLIEEFRINYPPKITEYIYSETSMSLTGDKVFTNISNLNNNTNPVSVASPINDIQLNYLQHEINYDTAQGVETNPSAFYMSNDLGTLVDDPSSELIAPGGLPGVTIPELSQVAPNHKMFTVLNVAHNIDIALPPYVNSTSPDFPFDGFGNAITNEILGEIDYNEAPSSYDRLIFGYDFSDDPKIIHRYQWFSFKPDITTLQGFIFEGSNAATPGEASNKTGTSAGDQWVPLDIWGNINFIPFKNELANYNGVNIIPELGDSTNPVFNNFQSSNDGGYPGTNSADYAEVLSNGNVNNNVHILDRGLNDFNNTTPYKYYRFKMFGQDRIKDFYKFSLYETTISNVEEEAYNPKHISIYSSENNPNFNLSPGIFKGTTPVAIDDTSTTASIATFNEENEFPISQYYTLEFSGSYHEQNMVGVSNIQPVTRSFTTQSSGIGPGLCFPGLPSQSVDCSEANVVYWDETTGCLFYTSSCANNLVIDQGGNIVFGNKVQFEEDILISSSIIIKQDKFPIHSLENDGEDFNVIVHDTSGELKSLQQRVVTTDDDGDIDLDDGVIVSSGGTFGDVQIVNDEIKPKDGKELKIKADKIVPSDGKELIVEADKIVPSDGKKLSLGDRNAPIDEMHIKQGTIHFYSSSDAYSGSEEVASMTINESTKQIEFKSGSEFSTIRAKTMELGPSPISSVQISDDGQGFIAVMAEPGKFSTVLRAESSILTGDYRMGSITQKSSGSFAILLDADNSQASKAKFVVESNTAIPGAGTRLFSVSESFETRVHNGGLKADNYVTTTNITASGNISSSGTIIANSITSSNFVLRSQKSILAENTLGAINRTIVTNLADSGLTFGDTSISTTLQGSEISTQVNTPINLNGNVTSSGNISGSHVTTASFGSLQLSNLPTSPTGLPTGSVWVSGSKNDNSTNNVNCGTLMIVI